MPLYEYECTACGNSFEVMQKLSDPVLTDCPACENGRVRRKIFAVGSIFKGSGFYATEYRSKDYVEREKAEIEAEKQQGTLEKTGDKKTEESAQKTTDSAVGAKDSGSDSNLVKTAEPAGAVA
jgi:putative FmdB family regulatory protein